MLIIPDMSVPFSDVNSGGWFVLLTWSGMLPYLLPTLGRWSSMTVNVRSYLPGWTEGETLVLNEYISSPGVTSPLVPSSFISAVSLPPSGPRSIVTPASVPSGSSAFTVKLTLSSPSFCTDCGLDAEEMMVGSSFAVARHRLSQFPMSSGSSYQMLAGQEAMGVSLPSLKTSIDVPIVSPPVQFHRASGTRNSYTMCCGEPENPTNHS